MLRVASFPRSGTHLLMATIWYNFEVPYDCSRQITVQNAAWRNGTECLKTGETANVPWSRIFAGHGPYRPSDETTILIVRHFEELYPSYTSLFGDTVVADAFAMWKATLMSFAGQPIIRYEDLVADPEAIVDALTTITKMVRRPFRPVTEIVGWIGKYPRRAAVLTERQQVEVDLLYPRASTLGARDRGRPL